MPRLSRRRLPRCRTSGPCRCVPSVGARQLRGADVRRRRGGRRAGPRAGGLVPPGNGARRALSVGGRHVGRRRRRRAGAQPVSACRRRVDGPRPGSRRIPCRPRLQSRRGVFQRIAGHRPGGRRGAAGGAAVRVRLDDQAHGIVIRTSTLDMVPPLPRLFACSSRSVRCWRCSPGTNCSEVSSQAIFRWFHIIAGIIWLGHLYFFNLVNVPFQADLDKELKPQGEPAAAPARPLLVPLGRDVHVPVRLVLFFRSIHPRAALFRTRTGADERRGDVDPVRVAARHHHVVQRLVRDLAAAEDDPGRRAGRPRRHPDAAPMAALAAKAQHLRCRARCSSA